MPAPYNYSLGTPPAQSFLQGLAMSQAIDQQQQQRQQQQALQERARAMQQDLGALSRNPSDTAFNAFYAKYPEMQKQLQGWQQSLSEQDHRTIKDAVQEALVLLKSGRGGEVPAIFDRYSEAAKNSGRNDLAQQIDQAKQEYTIDPQHAGPFALKMLYHSVDPEGYKTLFPEGTTFQKDFKFIRDTFGPQASAEFAQYGRNQAPVSIPIGPGKTWVGPASQAPGMGRWQEQGGTPSAGMTDQGAGSILEKAANAKKITQAEASMIQKSLGPEGNAKFDAWLTKNNIKVVVRTGTDANGRRVEQYSDGTIGYAD